ncbi:unnamed protein product [Penicillium pancosmium]
MLQSWNPPRNYRNRPVVILGAGVLGRRIGCIWASAGFDVRLRDPNGQQREDGLAYIRENVASYAKETGDRIGTAHAFEEMEEALADAWLVIEAVPEKIQLKIDTFAQLEMQAPNDCILASNSSSYRSSEMLEKVSESAKRRILNMHYYMPPQCMVVELMTDGHTEEGIFPFMVERCKEGNTLPFIARKESTGFIFNRLWAAVKRETLSILAEGVSVPEEIDTLWTEMFVKGRSTPCKMMDQVGLDTVALIETHYVQERGISSENTVDYLNENYIKHGKLGTKSSQGGLYAPVKSQTIDGPEKPPIIVLDLGLSAASPTMASGSVLELSRDRKQMKTLVENQSLPDGVAVDPHTGKVFWTNMGIPGKNDGNLVSFDRQENIKKELLPKGSINTPKQLALDTVANKIYFCDREGLAVYRCNFDGSQLEKIVQAGNPNNPKEAADARNWCVGITVAPKLGKFYWTQKGPSKSGQGRIFCANILLPEDQSLDSRTDVECIVDGLPEPIDLEVDEESCLLYWTDRGEIPYGNSLNRLQLGKSGSGLGISTGNTRKVLARHFNEAIGLKLDTKNNTIYVTDLGGNIYRCDLNGDNKSVLYSDEFRAFTGIALF